MASNVVTTTSVKYEISKFDGGTSFSLWKIRMWSSLMLQGLWKAVEEKFSGVSEESKVELQERALSAIFMSVTDSVLREIATEKTASDAWKKLEELYSGKSLTNRLYLKKWLYNLRMDEGTPVKQHLDVFNSIIMDLGNIDIKVESKDCVEFSTGFIRDFCGYLAIWEGHYITRRCQQRTEIEGAEEKFFGWHERVGKSGFDGLGKLTKGQKVRR